jgi:hypothetical protein
MSTLLRYKTCTSTAALWFVIPTLLLSQVIIREKVEIKPKPPDKPSSKLQRLARTAGASDRFYNPPLFVLDPLRQEMGLTLPSTVTISGTIDITGPIGGNQRAAVVYIDPFGTEHEIAWKGREPIAGGGKMYEGESPYTGMLDKGSFPSVSLYLFDGQWSSRAGEVTMADNTLSYTFNGLLYQGTLPAVPVTATATVTGSFLPDVLLDHWNILAQDMTVTGLDSTWVRFAPIDGIGGIYRPWGISPREAEITARVDAKGDYVFLAYIERAGAGEEPGSGIYHSGKELTMSLMYTPFLVYDESRGTFDGATDTVYVTVTGGRKSKTVPVILKKTQILLGETKYFYIADVDGRPTIKETNSTSVPEDLLPDFEWGDEPVGVVESVPNSGKRLGVYWEKKKPDGTTLPDGMIRLVGRYWQADSLYKVGLIATGPYETVSLVVEVKRPEKLHDPEVFSKPFDVTLNIRGQPLDIDELCIEYGGKIGIPPQVIKGQMFQESDKAGDRFNPSYRYEPWADYRFAGEKLNPKYWKDYRQQPFWITGQLPKPMGEGKDVPLDHQNVHPVYYPTTPISIADYAINNWGKYWDSQKLLVVGSSEGTDNLTARWREYLTTWYAGWSTIGQDPYWLATQLLHRYIRGKYVDYAQTRKAASYGLIQMLYTTALVQEYNKGKSISTSSAPEELNDETVEMSFYQTFTERNLRLQFGSATAVVPEANWSKGWEETWMDSFKKYNSAPEYGRSVFNHARKFSPQKKQGTS